MLRKKGLYIHIPFCKYICTYCDFCKKDIKYYDTDKYIKSLILELKKYSNNFNQIDSIYIGGGTPSSLSYNQLDTLLTFIKENINMDNIIEYTLEMNPDDVNENKIKLFKEKGVNRISLGVQSLENNILKKINRMHTFSDVENAIDIISKDIENISIDLMFNLPDQKKEHIKNTFDFLKKNNGKIRHISYYSLILEEHTRLYNEKYFNLNEDEEDDIYKLIQEKLKALGYKQYEISNFSLDNFESKHNIKYWTGEEYIGVGVGASSYIDGIRKTTTRSIQKYYELYDNDKKYTEIEKIEEKDALYEKIMLGLRMTSGIKYDVILNNKIKIDLKYFTINNSYISIKEEFLFLSNQIIIDILEQI